MSRIVWTAIVVVIGLTIAVPLITRLVDVLFVPVVIGVVLYLAVRIVNARLDRW
jgi:predicted PurR-regulated permease PerM